MIKLALLAFSFLCGPVQAAPGPDEVTYCITELKREGTVKVWKYVADESEKMDALAKQYLSLLDENAELEKKIALEKKKRERLQKSLANHF